MAAEVTGSGGVTRRVVLAGGLATVMAAIGLAKIPRHSKSAADVVFTTTGSQFSPRIELMPGSTAEVVWFGADGVELARGDHPTISFPTAEPRTIRMKTVFPDVITVNLGFNPQDDAGRYSLDARYAKSPDEVSGVFGLGLLGNLRRFLAGRTGLSGPLDVSGLALLEHIECFQADLDSIDLAGCTSLVRLCVEQNRLSALDLNPVAASLRDLRAAGQKTGSLEFVPLRTPLASAYHVCIRDQHVQNHPSSDKLPVCEDLWNWNCSQDGALPTPGFAHSVLAAGNAYTSADLSGQWVYEGGWGTLDLTDNKLTSVDVRGCVSLQAIRLGGNRLGQAAVDRLLTEVDSWGTTGFEVRLDGTNSAPSSTGLAAVASLRDRGWTVTIAPSGTSE